MSCCKIIKLDSQVKILETFFNSLSGKIYKLISDLELIIIVIDETKFSFNKVLSGMKHIEYNVERYHKQYDTILTSKSKKTIKNKTEKLITLDKKTRDYIEQNVFLKKFIAL